MSFLGIEKEVISRAKRWDYNSVYPIRIYHSTLLLGPLYQAGGSPCPHCLEGRWLANRPLEEQNALDGLQKAHIFGGHQKFLPAALEAIWAILETDLGTHDLPRQSTGDWFYELHLDTLHIARYQLIADSNCDLCAHPVADRATPLQLTSRVKRALTNYRLVSSTDYTLPEQGYINRACGLLGTEAAFQQFHVVTAPVIGKWGLRTPYRNTVIWWGGHHTSFAKSRRVGLLEGLERYCSHWPRARFTTVIESYQNLGEQALDPLSCGTYLPEAYQGTNKVQPFDPEAPIPWVWGYSFRQERPILVPEILAYFCSNNNGKIPFVQDSSNGCAIGSCLEEAIIFGLLELVERDGFLMSWYAQLAPPHIDPWSSKRPETLRILDRIDKLGFDTYLLDSRFDLPFPIVTSVAVRRNDGLGKFALAASASLDPEDALRSAMYELAAYLPDFAERVKSDLSALYAGFALRRAFKDSFNARYTGTRDTHAL